jgi:alcohol dehydrogenase
VGHTERVQSSLASAGCDVVLFDQVIENPTTREVAACVEVAKSSGHVDLIVGLGGGSAIDTAKGCNFLYTNGGQIQDYWGVGKASKPMLPLIAIPTTAGTGTECQSFALIADPETHQKMACGDPKAAARIAVLDPTLTITQPGPVAAATGMDAIAHAVETAVTTKRNQLSWLYSREAFRLTQANLPRVLEDGQDLRARSAMQLGAALSGLAIENSMLGAAHAAANPLTARFGIVHGQAVGVMLPKVIRFNSEDDQAKSAYTELALVAGLVSPDDPMPVAIDALLERLACLLNVCSLSAGLIEFGVDRDLLGMLAEEAARQWTATFNPRPIKAADFVSLYESAFE